MSYIGVMKNFFALLLLFQTASVGLAFSNSEVDLHTSPDSVETAKEIAPEHYPSMFDAAKLESATSAKYVGSGLSIAGGLIAAGGATDAGIAVAAIGAIVGFFGRVGQDIQLVRLGWKHGARQKPKGGLSVETPVLSVGCPNLDLKMGDNVSFKSTNNQTLVGEVIGIVESAVGCQIIVRYEFQGEFKTSTLSPGSLNKI